MIRRKVTRIQLTNCGCEEYPFCKHAPNATQDIQNIHPTKRTFGELAIGDVFDFIDMSRPMFNSFYRQCVKISVRGYQALDEPRTIYRIGSISAKVFHVNENR